MLKYLNTFIFILFFFQTQTFAAEIYGTVSSLQSPGDLNISGLTNLERKKFEESLVVASNKGLSNAIVYIEKVPSSVNYSVKHAERKIDQKNNAFTPRVTPIIVGEELTIKNSDKVFHNVHAYLNGENLFIANLPKYQQKSTHRVDKEGVISMKCEVHLSMQAYALVLNNPFFSLTDKNGKFSIKNILPGDYKLVSWHELLGRKQKKITIRKNKDSLNTSFVYEHITAISPRWY